MQLTVEALEEQLSRNSLAPCYFLVSTNAFLLQEMRDAIWQVATQKGFAERQKWDIQSKYDWGAIKRQNNAFDLFQRPFIELRCAKSLDGATCHELVQFVKKLHAETAFSPIIVVSYEKWTSQLQKTDWFQKLVAISTFVIIHSPSSHQLPYWLKKELKRAQLTLTQEAMLVLVKFIEGNLSAAKQMIQKLFLLYSNYNKPICLEKLHLVLQNEVIFELSHLTETILQQNLEKCLRIVQHLESTQTPPALVLGCLLKLLRIASGLRDGMDRGQNILKVFEKYGVWQKQQSGLKQIVRNLSQETIALLFKLAYDAERCIKGVNRGSSWLYLKQLTFCLAGCSMPFLKQLPQY